MSEKLFILDGHYLIYRSYHALKRANMRTSSGQPTGAIFGLLRLLMVLFEDYDPDYLVCALDSKEPTFRHEFYEDYKDERPEMPDDLRAQIPEIKKLFELLDIPVLLEPGFESDDLIASLVHKWQEQDQLEIVIVSNDKDIFQLVNDKVSVLKQKSGLSEVKMLDEKGVEEELGVKPEKVADFLALVGDKSDNVPGVAGVGPAYAKKILDSAKNIENMLQNPRQIPERFRDKIKEAAEQITSSKHLVDLRLDAPVDLELERLKWDRINYPELIEFCRQKEINSIQEKLEKEAGIDSDWDELDGGYELVSLKELLAEEEFLDRSRLAGLFTTYPPEKKMMKAKKLYWFLAAGEKCRVVEISPEDVSRDTTDRFESVISKIKTKNYYTYRHKNGVLTALRLGGDFPVNEKLFDLQLGSYVVRPESNHELEEILKQELKMTIPEPEKMSEEIYFNRQARKVRLLVRAALELKEKIDVLEQQKVLEELELPLVEILGRMEYNGIKLDVDRIKQLQDELEGKLKSLEEKAHRLAEEKFNLNSPKQIREILFDNLGLPKKGKTGSGKPSTDADSLRELQEHHPLPGVILEHRRFKKVESTYLQPMIDAVNPHTGRIHTEFNQAATATGRLSSSSPNLQNIPVREQFGRQVREAFVPGRDDFQLLAADYSQIELRLLAHISGDKTLVEAFKKGRDIHSLTAAQLNNKSPSEVEESERRTAKVVNYGITYGLSAFGLARDLDISREEAKKYIEDYFCRYPGVKKYIEKTEQEAREKGYVCTLWGRRRYVPELTSDDFYRRQFARRVAVNAPIQGTAADMMKKAMIDLEPRLENYNCNLLLQVHDELILEVARGEIMRLEEEVRSTMAAAMKLDVPVKVSTKIGNNWGEISK